MNEIADFVRSLAGSWTPAAAAIVTAAGFALLMCGDRLLRGAVMLALGCLGGAVGLAIARSSGEAGVSVAVGACLGAGIGACLGWAAYRWTVGMGMGLAGASIATAGVLALVPLGGRHVEDSALRWQPEREVASTIVVEPEAVPAKAARSVESPGTDYWGAAAVFGSAAEATGREQVRAIAARAQSEARAVIAEAKEALSGLDTSDGGAPEYVERARAAVAAWPAKTQGVVVLSLALGWIVGMLIGFHAPRFSGRALSSVLGAGAAIVGGVVLCACTGVRIGPIVGLTPQAWAVVWLVAAAIGLVVQTLLQRGARATGRA